MVQYLRNTPGLKWYVYVPYFKFFCLFIIFFDGIHISVKIIYFFDYMLLSKD